MAAASHAYGMARAAPGIIRDSVHHLAHRMNYNKVSSVMGRDDSWPATVLTVVLTLWYSLSDKATQKHPKWRNRTSDRESDDRF